MVESDGGKVNFLFIQLQCFYAKKHSSIRGATNADRVLERGTEMHVHRQTGCLVRCS